ncbi:hypothetical protein QAD02_007136 [Eretmocerus hayati]|uniref:Uncharacterized protein n=1 Tax=Eretmocerus hayati TaxID=131215 RepID=A0ACC2N349_9HYME|nr:hypothetical protein QAD02_007136 [Eretmocerus hayati]
MDFQLSRWNLLNNIVAGLLKTKFCDEFLGLPYSFRITPPESSAEKAKRARVLGRHWEGFTPVRNKTSLDIEAAHCHVCNNVFTKHNSKFLLSHRAACLKQFACNEAQASASPTEPTRTEQPELSTSNTLNCRRSNELSPTEQPMASSTQIPDGQTSFLSAAIDETGKYIAVDWCLGEECTRESLEKFCVHSVELVRQSYKVLLSFIVTNCNTLPDPIHYPELGKFVFYLNTFTELLSSLKEVVFAVNSEGIEKANQFLSTVTFLTQNMASLSMSDVVSHLMDLRHINGCIGNRTVNDLIGDYLEPIHILYLNPNYHHSKMSDEESDLVFEYIATLMEDENTTACFSDYHNKLNLFDRLFKSNLTNPDIFWLRAMRDYQSFSVFAKRISVPAEPKLIDKEKILKFCPHLVGNAISKLQLAIFLGDSTDV